MVRQIGCQAGLRVLADEGSDGSRGMMRQRLWSSGRAIRVLAVSLSSSHCTEIRSACDVGGARAPDHVAQQVLEGGKCGVRFAPFGWVNTTNIDGILAKMVIEYTCERLRVDTTPLDETPRRAPVCAPSMNIEMDLAIAQWPCWSGGISFLEPEGASEPRPN